MEFDKTLWILFKSYSKKYLFYPKTLTFVILVIIKNNRLWFLTNDHWKFCYNQLINRLIVLPIIITTLLRPIITNWHALLFRPNKYSVSVFISNGHLGLTIMIPLPCRFSYVWSYSMLYTLTKHNFLHYGDILIHTSNFEAYDV